MLAFWPRAKISLNTIVAPSPAPTADAPATRQFWLAFAGGFGLAVPLSLLFALASYWHLFQHAGSETWLPMVLRDWWQYLLLVAGGAVLPALATGALLWLPMRWLLGCCRALGSPQSRWLGVLGTLGLFEAGVLLLTGLGYAIFHQSLSPGQCYRICASVSLPWGLAALGATWRVLRPLATQGGPVATS
jgi:hypothetical protein